MKTLINRVRNHCVANKEYIYTKVFFKQFISYLELINTVYCNLRHVSELERLIYLFKHYRNDHDREYYGNYTVEFIQMAHDVAMYTKKNNYVKLDNVDASYICNDELIASVKSLYKELYEEPQLVAL